MHERLCLRSIAWIALLTGPALMAAGRAPRTPQAGPAPGARLVTVDFRVVSGAGLPVLDLKPGDVSLKVAGRARQIRALDLIRFADRQTAADGSAVPALPPPFASNHPADLGRVMFFLLEDDSIQAGQEPVVRDAVNAVLDTLSANDRVGLMVVSRGVIDVNLTTRHDEVRAAVGRFVGRAPRSETADDAACRTLRAVGAVKGVIESLSGETQSTVLFLSSGLATFALAGAPALRSQNATSVSATCELRREVFTEVSAAAAKASVDVYAALVPSDAQATVASALAAETGLENLASVTGNKLIRLPANMKSSLALLAQSSSAYYLVTFETDAGDRAGSAASVEVRVARDKTSVKARSEVTIPKGPAGGGGAQTAKDLLRVPTAFRDLPLRAVTQSARGTGDNDLVQVVMFEPFDRSLAFTSAAVGLFDEKGKLVNQWTAQPAELASLPVKSALTPKPGTYRMRVAAVDTLGRAGTVDRTIRVELEKGEPPLMMSTLLLGAAVGGGLAPRQVYRLEPSALGYFEVYSVPTAATVTAVIELATTPTGPAVASAPARVGRPGSDGRRVVVGEIAIGSLQPGDHVIRFVVSVDGKPAGRIFQTLRKVAP